MFIIKVFKIKKLTLKCQSRINDHVFYSTFDNDHVFYSTFVLIF